ncbi:site-specific integrase [Aureimonas sp. SA4125]|uniref:tyrosine-type recombinase/integrase n=1 Tax=Aureimonas sp. SA4125 TaxID=2826993 RepID=UPI00226B5D4D|nr:site-specific integrase [Aureimonas sp. SA4125]
MKSRNSTLAALSGDRLSHTFQCRNFHHERGHYRLLRITIQGNRRDIGLGGTSVVSLAEAREKALEFRKLAREGGDPLAERRKVRRITPTFAEAVELVHAEHASTWKNAKHAQQWRNTLQQYACPFIGEKPVDKIDTPDILLVLSPIWLTKQETARRVRQRIGTVLDWAKASGHRDSENPINGVAKGLPKQGDRKSHHSALPYKEVPDFVTRLRSSGDAELSRLAFEFLILTAARTSEALGARWDEINMEGALWTVPADRMKAGRIHRVPLSARSLQILDRAAALGGGSSCIFPGRSGDKPLSNMVFLMALRRMKVPITAHGFRSSFRDWAAETVVSALVVEIPTLKGVAEAVTG